jgi:glycerol uptake facilitator
MTHLLAECLGTALMIVFGVGVHCDDVLNETKYHGSGHLFAITTWGFGITITLYLFGGVFINPSMTLAQAVLGRLPWSMVVPYCLAQVSGGFLGAFVVFVLYKDHFMASAGRVEPVRVRNIFSTSPGIRHLPRNFFSEFFATFIFIACILGFSRLHNPAMEPILVGLLVWAIGMALGGTTGFAMNLARDMGPRLAHAVLPIKNKADNDWQYGCLVPGIAPLLGGACAALTMRIFVGM